MAQGDVVSPSAQGGLSPHARLQLLQGLIVSVGTSLPPLLARWGFLRSTLVRKPALPR